MSSLTGSRAGSMCSNRKRDRGGSQAGFTLVEILVAFSVLALALGALLPAFSGGLKSIGASESYVRASLLARSTTDRVGIEIPLEEGEYSGTAEDGFDWSVQIRRLEAGDRHRDEESAEEIESFEVETAILRDGKQQVTLKTLRIAPME